MTLYYRDVERGYVVWLDYMVDGETSVLASAWKCGLWGIMIILLLFRSKRTDQSMAVTSLETLCRRFSLHSRLVTNRT